MPTDKPPASLDRYEHEEFVVTLPYASAVCHRTRTEFGVACEVTNSPKLNLSLVRPQRLAESAGAIRQAVLTRLADRDRTWVLDIVPAPTEPGRSPLNDLMFCLRFDFAAEYGGWSPSMGKNRVVENVTGLPHADGGSVGEPDPAPALAPASSANLHRGTGVRVGIVDTRLFPHPRLAGSYLAAHSDLLPAPTDLLPARPAYSRFAGHATFVAGRVLRQAPAAELDIRHTLNDQHARTTLWDLVHRMVSFRDSGVQILNLSLGCYTSDGQPPMVLARAVQLLAPDIVVVAAAGNHGDANDNVQAGHPDLKPTTPFWPAALDDVLAVGADLGPTDPTRSAPFSPRLPWVTFTAEGSGVVSTYLDGKVEIPSKNGPQLVQFDGYARWSGTSFAAATVTGELAALIRPGTSAWEAVAELKERTEQDPSGPVRLFAG
jgi:hypothetical protein